MAAIKLCGTLCDLHHRVVEDSLVKLHAQTTSDSSKCYLYVVLEKEVREIGGDVEALPAGSLRRMSF